jgi:GNAT superfamily N-acetyltransferase
MLALSLGNRAEHSDVVCTRRGDAVMLRFARPDDAEALQAYVRGLSSRSRYNRFLGALSELPKTVLEDFTHAGRDDRFSLVATIDGDGREPIVAEARYALHPEDASIEFGLSVQDRWQGHGIGPALLANLECRAAALGAICIFGDTLRSNEVMIRLAKKSGYLFRQHPDDWRLVRFEKNVAYAPAEIPCASWRIAATAPKSVGVVSR